MNIQSLNNGFIMPTKGSASAGAYDIYMPEAGTATNITQLIGLGFAAEVPENHVALLLPRSSAAKSGIELANTCGVIDADYRGEWKAALRTKAGNPVAWAKGDRLIQFLIVPVAQVAFTLVDSVSKTERGSGSFGSSGS